MCSDPKHHHFPLAALLSSMRLMISASSSSMDLSILAPREGSFPCILAGRVGSCSPAICSWVFFLPLPSSGSFWSLACARRFAMLRSSSVEYQSQLWSHLTGVPSQDDVFSFRGVEKERGDTHWGRCLGGSSPCPPRKARAGPLSSARPTL